MDTGKIPLSARGKTLLFYNHVVCPAETQKDKNISVCKAERGQKYKEMFQISKKIFQKLSKIEHGNEKNSHHGKYGQTPRP